MAAGGGHSSCYGLENRTSGRNSTSFAMSTSVGVNHRTIPAPPPWTVKKEEMQQIKHLLGSELMDLQQKGLIDHEYGDKIMMKFSTDTLSDYKLGGQFAKLKNSFCNLNTEYCFSKCLNSTQREYRDVMENCRRKYPDVYIVMEKTLFKIVSKDLAKIKLVKAFLENEDPKMTSLPPSFSQQSLLRNHDSMGRSPQSHQNGSMILKERDQTRNTVPKSRQSRTSVSTGVNFEFSTSESMKVKVYQGNLLDARVDAIVNAANESLQHAGGVAQAISQACGSELQSQCKDIIRRRGGPLKVRDVKDTTAGILKDKFKAVLHAVGPCWDDYGDSDKEDCLDDLQQTVQNVLRCADQIGCHSVAMPAISSGLFSVPPDLCAEMYLYGIFRYSSLHGYLATLGEIHIVDTNPSILGEIGNAYEISSGSSFLLDPKSARKRHQASFKASMKPKSHRQERGSASNGLDALVEMRHLNTVPKSGQSQAAVSTGVNFEFCTSELIKVKVYQGNLLEARVDAIVNAANESLQHVGGVAQAISQACGSELQSQCKDVISSRGGPLKVGDVKDTTAGILKDKFKAVLHAVGPCWDDYGDSDKEDCLDDLQQTVQNVLRRADQIGCHSVAMPAISSGLFSVPSTLCAEMYIYGIFKYSPLLAYSARLREIHIVDTNPSILRDIENVYKRSNGRSFLLDPTYARKRHHALFKTSLKPYSHRQEVSPSNDAVALAEMKHGRIGSSSKVPLKKLPDDHIKGVTDRIPVFELDCGLKIKVYTGSLVRFKGDAIVCTADVGFSGVGQLAQAVEMAGGETYRRNFMKMKSDARAVRIKEGDVHKCKGGDLKVGTVFHTVVRSLITASPQNLKEYEEALKRVFTYLQNKSEHVRDIAMPLIGGGMLSERELDSCCATMCHALLTVFGNCSASSIKELHIINKNPSISPVIVEILGKSVKTPAVNAPPANLDRSSSGDNKTTKRTDDDDDMSVSKRQSKASSRQRPRSSNEMMRKSFQRQHSEGSRGDQTLQSDIQGNVKDYHKMGARPKHSKRTVVYSGDHKQDFEDKDALLDSISTKISKSSSSGDGNAVTEADTGNKPKGNLTIIGADDDDVNTSCDFCMYHRRPEKLKKMHCGYHVYCIDCISHMQEVKCIHCSDTPREPQEKTPDKAWGITEDEDPQCVICMDTLEDGRRLDCGHEFCAGCIESAFSHKPACPVCGVVFGEIKGNQPSDGTMTYWQEASSLQGFESCGTTVIEYKFSDGTQEQNHPKPGQPYKGTVRKAYLPDNAEGRKVLRSLETAFKQKLTFTIGSSRTTGQEDVVTWNDIHHKTRREGGPQRFGYPDPTYLQRVQEELAAKGITDINE